MASRACRRSSPASAAAKSRFSRTVRRIHRGLLEHESQSSPGRAARPHHVVTEHRRMSTGGAQQRGKQEHRGRLAGTVRTQQAHQLPGSHPQGEAVQSPRASVVAAESLGRDGGLGSRGLRLARELAVGEWRGGVRVGERRLDDVVVGTERADRVGHRASPVSAKAWQRHPPKSMHFRSQVLQGDFIQLSPRNALNSGDSCQIHSMECSRTFG